MAHERCLDASSEHHRRLRVGPPPWGSHDACLRDDGQPTRTPESPPRHRPQGSSSTGAAAGRWTETRTSMPWSGHRGRPTANPGGASPAAFLAQVEDPQAHPAAHGPAGPEVAVMGAGRHDRWPHRGVPHRPGLAPPASPSRSTTLSGTTIVTACRPALISVGQAGRSDPRTIGEGPWPRRAGDSSLWSTRRSNARRSD